MFRKYWKSSGFQPASECLVNLQRRTFLVNTAQRLGGLVTIAVLPSLHVSEDARAAQIAANDPRILTERVALDADWGKLDCYFARPNADTGLLPGVIVVHDKLGLTPHFEDVARRLALEGFVALAPDYASRFASAGRLQNPDQP